MRNVIRSCDLSNNAFTVEFATENAMGPIKKVERFLSRAIMLTFCSGDQEAKSTGAIGGAFGACFDLTVPLRDLDRKEQAIWKRWAYKPASERRISNMEPTNSTASIEPDHRMTPSPGLQTEAMSAPEAQTPPDNNPAHSATDALGTPVENVYSDKPSQNTPPTAPRSRSPQAAVLQPFPQASAITVWPVPPPSPLVKEVTVGTTLQRPIEAPKSRSLFRRGMQAGKDALSMLIAHQPDMPPPEKRSIDSACTSPLATAKRKRIR